MTACWICDGPVCPCARFAPEPFLECRRCGFAFRPDLDAAALRKIYAEGEYGETRSADYLDSLQDRRRDARVRLRYIKPWAYSGKLIDIGAAGGAFVAEAGNAGFDAYGIEPVPSFARAAREKLGVDVREGTIEDAELDTESCEVITLWHVLEHLREPVAHLHRLGRVLSDGGVLAVEVPNAGSAVAERLGASWAEPNVHVNQFTPLSLRMAMERAGFEVLDLHTVAITPYLTAPRRIDPRHLAGRMKAAIWLRHLSYKHPAGHELMRCVARYSHER